MLNFWIFNFVKKTMQNAIVLLKLKSVVVFCKKLNSDKELNVGLILCDFV